MEGRRCPPHSRLRAAVRAAAGRGTPAGQRRADYPFSMHKSSRDVTTESIRRSTVTPRGTAGARTGRARQPACASPCTSFAPGGHRPSRRCQWGLELLPSLLQHVEVVSAVNQVRGALRAAPRRREACCPSEHSGLGPARQLCLPHAAARTSQQDTRSPSQSRPVRLKGRPHDSRCRSSARRHHQLGPS